MHRSALRHCLAWSARIAGVAVLIAAFGIAQEGRTPPPGLNGTRPAASVKASQGYWLLAADGGIFSYGDASYYGPNRNLGRDIVAMARTPSGAGFWTVDDDGDVFHYGDAAYYGSRLIHPDDIAGFAARPQGDGYWMVTRDGVVWQFGNAPNLSPPAPLRPRHPIVGMASTPSGLGYWLVATDGGIFAFGDAAFYGSTGNITLNKPIRGIAPTPSGRGYWMVATDGGIFSYGDAAFYGSTGAIALNKPIVGMTSTGTGAGYWLVATDGGIFAFGDAAFYGSTGGVVLNQPVVGMAATPPLRTNSVPVAAADAATLGEDGTITVDVLANDAGLGDGGLTVTVVAPPTHGSSSVTPDGRVAYTPGANWSGTETVTYQVRDVDGDTNSAPLTLTVVAVNDAPLAGDQSLTTAEDLPASGTVTAADIDGDTPTYILASPAGHGSGTVTSAGSYTYAPATNYNGQDTFTIGVSDGRGGSGAIVVRVTVTPVNDAPVAADQALPATEDTPLTGTIGGIDVDGDPLSYAVAPSGAPTHGTVAVNPTTGAFTYTPAANYGGPDAFTVVVADGHGGSDSATINVSVTPWNDPPTISAIADVTINEDSSTAPLSFTVGDTETSVSSLTVSNASADPGVVAATGISLGGSGSNRTVTVTPVSNASGTATITVTVSDGAATASEAFVVSVLAVNDPPVAANQSLTTAEDTPASGSVNANDVDDAILTCTVTGPASHGTATVIPTCGAFTYVPAANYNGVDSFTVTVSDGRGGTDTALISVTVTAANDPPTISPITDRTIDEDTSTGPIGFTVGDGETSVTALVVTAASSDPAVVPTSAIVVAGTTGSRSVTVTPAPNASGTTTITLTVSDGSATASVTFTVAILAVNDAPTISAIADRSTNEDTLAGPVAFTVGDAETPAGSLVVTGSSSNQAVVNGDIAFGGSGANRTVTISPAANASGTTTITITVSDGTATSFETFTLTVNAVNDAPVISPIADTVTNEDTAAGPISFTVADVETAAASLTVSGSSSNQSVVPNSSILIEGSAGFRTVTLTPAPNASGSTTITIAVSDGIGTSSDTFVLTVNAVNDLPTISTIPDLSIPLGTSTGLLAFTITDVETAAPTLAVTATSDNPAVVPNDALNLLLEGSGSARTLMVTPDPLASGTATITLTVWDGTTSVQMSFVLTVTP